MIVAEPAVLMAVRSELATWACLVLPLYILIVAALFVASPPVDDARLAPERVKQ